MLYSNINKGKLTMLYDLQSLKIRYKNYANINQKISLECKNGKLTRIKRGLYSDDLIGDIEVIANLCYAPSYISFEYALSYYRLIPEYVSALTSAIYGKKNNKKYTLDNALFTYSSIPSAVYPKGILIEENINGVSYKIASKEKALCDMLYKKYPVRSIKDLKYLLFEDLRIDEEELFSLDKDFINEIAPLYHSNTLNTFLKFINKEGK